MDEQQFFYAMEFIEGETTEGYVERCGPMSLRSALRVAWQVSKALAAAARQQLVHRDIKPANIMIVADSEEEDWPFVKLIDFGLVRSVLRGRDSGSATRSGFMGTAQFASPEQIEENEADVRSDIYSLGCTLWYLLTGEPPFVGSLASIFAQHLGSEPPWEKLRSFPPPVRGLLRRMLRKEPSERPASAVELRKEIEQCLAHVERQKSVAVKITRPVEIGVQWLTGTPRTRNAVICAVSAVGLALAFTYSGNNAPSPQPAPPAQTSDVHSANSGEWFDKDKLGSANRGSWGEPFWSSSLAHRVSFVQPAAHPSVNRPESWPPREGIWDAEVAEPFGVRTAAATAEDPPASTAKALADSFPAADSETEKVALRKVGDKNEVKKATKRSVKKPQRRVASRDRDRGFNPLHGLERARKSISRAIRRLL
jgi:serine/threonine protein kinase